MHLSLDDGIVARSLSEKMEHFERRHDPKESSVLLDSAFMVIGYRMSILHAVCEWGMMCRGDRMRSLPFMYYVLCEICNEGGGLVSWWWSVGRTKRRRADRWAVEDTNKCSSPHFSRLFSSILHCPRQIPGVPESTRTSSL
jgi:hypothetical protein